VAAAAAIAQLLLAMAHLRALSSERHLRLQAHANSTNTMLTVLYLGSLLFVSAFL
jgi:hypothetical protein